MDTDVIVIELPYSPMESWAAYCHKRGLSIEMFSAGLDLRHENPGVYEDLGWPALDRALEATESTKGTGL